MIKILCVGPQWRGSNAGGMFKALGRIGNLIEIVDENYFINFNAVGLKSKIVSKLFRTLEIQEFNKAILATAEVFNPDLLFIYKGAFVLPETLEHFKSKKIPLVNFYPDVSFRTHGRLLAKTLPLYDYIFTTKTFGILDMKEQLGVTNSSFIPHGFDPEIHRPLDISQINGSLYSCDVSFIGGYSQKKAFLLSSIKQAFPEINLKIWGGRWENCSDKHLSKSIMNTSILGDLYLLGILSSKINLGLLHEKVEGASSGDKITSRTFHIPGAGGFMIHEKTEEVIQYFEEDKEVVFFETPEELCKKIEHYLYNPTAREDISKEGNKRAWCEHKLDHRAQSVISVITEKVLNR